jgi:hypothetical protein
MRAKEFLTEDNLRPANLFDPRHLSWRPMALIAKLEQGTPFVDKQGNNYFPTEGEAARIKPIVDKTLAALKKNPNAPLPNISIDMLDVGPVSLNKLEKADLQTAKGQTTSDVNVQPIGIGIATEPKKKIATAKGATKQEPITIDSEIEAAFDAHKEIPAGKLFDVIMSNPVLDQAGELGKAIKDAAKVISAGQNPSVKQYDEKTQKRIAIDAGEYLGILAMINNVADFPKRESFLKFLKASNLDNLALIFPGEQNSALADSYGVQNAQTGHTIMISSKGGKGSTATGAAPALSGLQQSINKRKDKIKPGNSLDFINTMNTTKPSARQGFAGMNWIAEYYPEALPARYKKLASDGIVFGDKDIAQVIQNVKDKGTTPIPKKFQSLISEPSIQASKGTDGGKLIYVVTKELTNIINSGIIPGFRNTVLELLDENFVQIFTRIIGGKLVFKVLWPGKVDGTVALHTKIAPGEPGKQALSFKVTD